RSWGRFAFLTLTLATLLSALLAILSTLWWRSLRLNLLATLATTTSPAADILRSRLKVFVVAVPLMFSALEIVLVVQIRIRILGIDGSARNRRLFAMFNAPFFLAFALFKGFGRTWSNRCARCVLEFLAFVLTLPLFVAFIWRRTWSY